MPILAEELYQNLVKSIESGESAPGAKPQPESVHLTDWLSADTSRIDENLNRDMRLVMRLASLGHSARSQAGIKVRQPLSRIDFSVTSREEVAALEGFKDLLADELNVMQVRALSSAGEAVAYSLKPLPRQLGQKYQSLFPRISKAIQALDADTAAGRFLDGEAVPVEIEGVRYDILPDEVEVHAAARPGLVVSTEGAYLAALHTELTPDLVQEGLAREFVRRVQDLRKQAGFEIADRIQIELEASPDLAQAVRAFRETIMAEVLAVRLEEVAIAPEAEATRLEFDGESALIRLSRRE